MNQQEFAFLIIVTNLLKIGLTIWAGFRAKALNRNIVGWVIFTFFLTLPAFIILLCLNKKKDKSEKKIEPKPISSSVTEKVIDRIQSINLKASKQHLIKKNWVLLKEAEEEKQVYIFQKDQTLLIAHDGDVIKGRWEEVGDNSLMIEFDNKSTLYQPSYESESIFILKVNGKEQYLYLVEEKLYEEGYRSVDMINNCIKNNREYFHSSSTRVEQEKDSSEYTAVITSKEMQKQQDRFTGYILIIIITIAVIIVGMYL